MGTLRKNFLILVGLLIIGRLLFGGETLEKKLVFGRITKNTTNNTFYDKAFTMSNN